MASRDKVRKIIRLGCSKLRGDITQEELEQGVNDILSGQEQMALGIGAVMPEEDNGRSRTH